MFADEHLIQVGEGGGGGAIWHAHGRMAGGWRSVTLGGSCCQDGRRPYEEGYWV